MVRDYQHIGSNESPIEIKKQVGSFNMLDPSEVNTEAYVRIEPFDFEGTVMYREQFDIANTAYESLEILLNYRAKTISASNTKDELEATVNTHRDELKEISKEMRRSELEDELDSL